MTVIFIVFLVSAGIQVVYYLFFMAQLARVRMKQHILDIEDKPVSIVVCSHNNLQQLQNLLKKLYIQAYRDFEIIIVDDRSDDGTYEFLIEEEKKKDNLKIVRVEWTPPHINEKKYALTLGIKAAKNEILLLTDSDCEPVSNNWIQTMVNQFDRKTKIVLGFSYYKKLPGLLNLFIRHETLQTALLYLSMAIAGMPYMGVGRNLAYKRSFFFSKNGFKKMLNVVGGDDDLFVNRYAESSNTDVSVHPESTVLSEPRNNLRSYAIQKIRHLSVGKRYKKNHKYILGLFMLSKLVFWLSLAVNFSTQNQIFITAGMLIIVVILTMRSFFLIAKKFGVKYEFGWVWIMDFVYISYLTGFSLAAILSKKIKWS